MNPNVYKIRWDFGVFLFYQIILHDQRHNLLKEKYEILIKATSVSYIYGLNKMSVCSAIAHCPGVTGSQSAIYSVRIV